MNKIGKLMVVVLALWAGAATGKSAAFPLDLVEGDRVSAGTEELTFSNLWDGDAEATVTIAQDGAAIFTGLTGEGTKTWTVDRNGRYVLTHTTYTNGVAGKVETAVFVVEGKEVPVGELTVAWEAGSYMYDNTGKMPGVTAKNGDQVLEKGVDYTVHYEGNTNAGTAKAILTGLPPYVGSLTNEFAIAKRVVELTSGSASKSYDGTPLVCHSVTTNGDGFVTGEGIDLAFTGSQTTVGSSKNTFDYTFKTGTWTGNYTITNTEGDLEVTKGTLPPDVKPDPVTPDPDDPMKPYSAFDYVGVYDGAGHTIDTNGLAAAFKGVVGDGFAVSYAVGESGGLGQPATPWSTVAPVFTNAATNVVWYKVSSANYADIVHAAKVAIVPRAITVASVGATWTYDTVAHGTNEVKVALTCGGSGGFVETALPEGEGIVVDEASFPTIADVGEKDNAFAWAFAEGTLAGNYAVTVRYGKLKVEARTIGDDDRNWDIRLDKAPMYDGGVKSAPIIQVCYVKPDGNLDYIPYTLAGNTATDAGNYKVRISGTGNYTGTVEKDWAIMPRNLKMTSGTAEWMYDGETHSNDTVTVTGDGFVAGEGATYAGFPQVTHFADAAEPVENAFTYKLNDNTKAQNYEIVTEKGKVAMTRRPITLTAPTKSKTYDGTPLTFAAGEIEVPCSGSGGQGLPALPAGEHFTFSNFASITEAGQVAATFSIADGTALMDDYDITVTPGATLTVMKSATEITVTAKSRSWTYDGEAHELHEYDATNLGTLIAGDRLEVTFSADSVVTTPVDGEGQDGVVANVITGVRVLRGEVDVSANYTLAWYPGALTVTKRPVTIASKGAVWTYDGTVHQKKEVEISLTGGAPGSRALPEGEGIVVDESSFASITDVGKTANAFAWHFASGTNAAYYEITKVEGELEVTAADISAGTEQDWEIVLGPALTYSGIAQIQTVTSVKFRGLDLDYTVSGNQQTDAGDYELTLTGLGNFTGEKTVAWKLNPKLLTLTAGSGSKPYDGTPLTVNTVTAEGFVAGESATFTCTGSQLDVGSSENVVTAIDWTGAKAGNYAVTKMPGVLKVVPLAVTVKSKDISKPFDGTPLRLTAGDVELSCGVPGGHALPAGESFVYGDFAERTEAGQTGGTFSIAAGANTKLANYAITPVYGTITITKSATEIGVTARSGSWPYDATAHELHEYDATNLDILQPGEELVVTFKAASKVTTPKDGPDADGKVANEVESVRIVKNGSQDVTDNYTVTPYPGVLTVTKRPVTVTVAGKTVSATYDGEEHSASGYDIATEDALYDIAAKTSFGGTDEVTRTDAGKSQMGLKASDFTNSDEYFDVTYAVTDGWVSVAQADISAGEEGDFVLALGANPKYNGTAQTIPVTAVGLKIRDGEGAVVTQLPVTYTLAGENATHAGTYTLTVKANGNFKGERSTTWRILKRQVKLTSGSASRAYNGQPLVNGAVTVGGDGFIGQEGATFEVTGSQTIAGSSKNTFAYTLKAGTLEGDYDIEKVEGDLVVTKAKYPGQEPGGSGITWNVSPDAATWMYDGSEHGVAVTGVPAGVTPVYVHNTAKDVGTYTASVTFNYDAVNYEAPVGPASIEWSITARPITLSSLTKERPYNGLPFSVVEGDITASGNGYAPGEKFEYYDYASITDVGETPATFKYRDSANAKVSNYVVTVVPGKVIKVTVGGDQISITSDSGTWAYDGNAHGTNGWSFVNGDKLLSGHEFRVKIADSSKIETPKDGPDHNGIVSNAFEYVRIVETATGADMTKNYNLFVYEGILQMTNRVVCSEELKVNGESFKSKIEKTYDGEPLSATITADLLQSATIRYGNSEAEISLSESPAFTHVTNAVVWFAVSADYYQTYTGKVEVVVGKRPITITTPTRSKPYDGTPLSFGETDVTISGEGFVTGEGFVYSDFASISNAGKINATCSYAAESETLGDDYAVTEAWGTLTILASADQITVTAKDGEWTYTGNPQTLHEYVAENEDKLISGDKLSVAFSDQSVITNPDDGPMGDGVVSNVITSVKVMRGDVDVTKNYSLAWYPGVLKMKNATMTVDDSTFATTFVYDGKGHTANVVAPTLLTSPVTVRYGTASDAVTSSVSPAFKDAGTHTVFYQISAKYYDVYSGSTTVKISPRLVTLVSAGAERVYNGLPLTKDEVSVKSGSLGFPDGDGYTAVCSGTITGVGAVENGFDYTLTGAAKSDNYVIAKEYGELRITYATLDPGVVIGPMPVPMNLTYDGAEHPFVFEPTFGEAYKIYYAAVPNDESAYVDTPIAFKNATAADVPVYFKMVTDNYHPLYGTGTVSVAARPVTFTSASSSKMYDGQPLTSDLVTVGGMGFVAGESFAFDVTGTITDAGMVKNGFSYAPASGTLAANYAVTKGEGTLEVTKRSVTLTSATASKKFDGAPLVAKTVSVTGDGWAGEEGATYDVTGAQTTVGATQNTFTYALTNGAKEGNYTITKVEGTLTVTQGEVVYTAQGYAAEYDGNGHSIAVAVTTPGGLVPKYSLMPEGPYSAALPMFTNVCSDVVVWYALEADQYAAVTNSATVTIAKRPLTAAMVNSIADRTYTGLEIKPPLTFTDAGNRRITTSDYTAVYSNNKNVGQVTVTVTATPSGNYSGTVTVHFNIVKASYDMSKAKWSSDAGFIYDGAEKSVTVSGLPTGVTVASYADNKKTHAGSYTARVTFDYDAANYKTPVLADKVWTIGKRSVTIKSQSASKSFDGTPLVKHVVDVTSGSFVSGEGLTYAYTGSQSEVGESPNTYTYSFKSGTLETDYAITKLTGTLTVVKGGIVYAAQGYAGEYDGEGHFIDVQVSAPVGLKPKYALAKEGPYSTASVAYTNVCTDVEIWYVLEASGYASVTNSAKVTITPRTLTAAMVNEIADQTYTGQPIKPALSFTDEGKRKIAAEDYTATYSDNTVAGTASVKISGTRNYAGVVTVTFRIVKASYDMSGAKWNYTTAFTYDKTEKSVSVTGLPAGVTVKAIAEGKKTHAGDYVAKVSFNYDADNYNEPKLADCPWKINRKKLAVTADAKTQTFGKAELPLTYKAPALCAGDALSGSVVRDPGTNVGKYAIRQGTLAHADYAITFTGATYEIVKAAINGGDEPGGGSVPAGGVSKFDMAFEYDGKGHTIDAATILAAFKGAVVGGVAECRYALSATPAVWLSAPPVFTNVCTKSIWYKAMSANYDDFVHEVRLTITARDIAKATIAPIPDVEFADKAATPTPVVIDGTPSIITASDYSVSYLNNAQPGTATLTLTGKGNYKGTKSANFTIKSAGVKYAVLTGKLAWKLNLGSGCYTAQLKLTCTDGLEQGISQLRFIYQDRTSGSTITSALYDSSKRSYRPTAVYSGTTYRYVDIDATKITKKNAEVTFGVKDVSQPKGVVSASECLIELYVRSLASPVSDIGYVVWKSNGATCTLPISASGGSQGITVQNNLKALKLAAKAPMCSAPLSTAALNTSLALGVVVDPASSPYCRLTDFAVGETGLRGRVEVGKETGGVETQGALGTNARAVLMGSKNLSDGFSEIGNVPVDESGSFQFYLGSKDYQFFRVRIDIQNVVE